MNPVTLEVVRNALYAIAEEMSVVLMRSARSPLLKEAGDLSCVLTDAGGRLVAQGQLDNPMHLGTMCFTVKELLERVPAERMRAGDVYFTNDPACGGNHLPDWVIARPVFVDGELAAFACNRAHQSDIGGGAAGTYNSDATEIYHEGLRLPVLKLIERGTMREDLWALLKLNSRGLEGDTRRRAEILRSVPETASLLRFAVSEEYLDARHRAGADSL